MAFRACPQFKMRWVPPFAGVNRRRISRDFPPVFHRTFATFVSVGRLGHVASNSRRRSVAAGQMTRHALRTRYTAIYRTSTCRTMPDSPQPRAPKPRGCGLGSDGVIAGRSAAALHGSKWVDPGHPLNSATTTGIVREPLQTADQIADDEGC